ncbi:DNA-binding protein [Klebsiella oxytoca]|nr:DNA-binding protein [Klebsiella oxytoca]
MTAKTKFKSPAFEAIHSAAAGLYSVDAIAQETMRSFDETCISRVSDFQPGEIKALRDQLNVSQPVFARYLNTSVSTVQKWESGAKRPGGLALKLLNIVQKTWVRSAGMMPL